VHIGEIIRQWREGGDVPMTRDAVALKTRRCVSTIRNWETGRDPRVSDLVDLEKAKPGLVALVLEAALAKKLRRIVERRPERRRKRRRKASQANGASAAQ